MDRRNKRRQETAYRDKQLVIKRTFRPSGLKLTGAVDASNVERFGQVLSSALNGDSDHDVHIDLTRLEFSDVSGIRALVAAAEAADDRHCLIVHGLPPLMSRVMDVVGWTELPALFISQSEFPDGGPTRQGEVEAT